MRPNLKVAAVIGTALAAGLLSAGPASASARNTPATVASDPITTCESGYHGWMRRAGKDAICLWPGERTWDIRVFECAGDLTLYFENGKHAYCGGSMKFGIDIAETSNVVKTKVGNR
ncbi:hypothetical protein [Amycolatopsis sp. cg9]|uniref:hypothetical protein n=1 Tax=Amycolatopsis sp. cg9 TaxID=3238801 RepID=UPI003524EEE9